MYKVTSIDWISIWCNGMDPVVFLGFVLDYIVYLFLLTMVMPAPLFSYSIILAGTFLSLSLYPPLSLFSCCFVQGAGVLFSDTFACFADTIQSSVYRTTPSQIVK